MKRILLPCDGSEASLKAVIPAKSISELTGGEICILNISKKKIDEKECLEKIGIKKEDLGCHVIINKTGNPAEIILEESKTCDCIVMGTQGKTCNPLKKTGSVAERVVKNTFKPVLLIKPDTIIKCKNGIWVPQKVLIPLNGAPGSAQALVPAMEIVAKTNAEIDLLHITCGKAEPLKEEGAYTAPYYEDYPQHEWSSWSNEFIRRFCPILPNHNNINIKLSLLHGKPGNEILNFARENNNDFIVMAWHGVLSRLRANVLKKVLFECGCPIMLIKIQEE